jgi:general secretion pathway protein K
MMINNKLGQQQGLALISVLLIFAIVAVLAGAMIERQGLDIQRSGNLQALQQARAYSTGIEYAVRSGLQLDFENDKEVDHLLEQWAESHTYPLSPGTAHIQIFDAQARFNLNSLHPSATNKAIQLQRFKNLLAELGLDEGIAINTAKFIDKDSQIDDDYLSAEIPYRASYNIFKHPSELLLVQLVDANSYRILTPYITTLPIAATLNVNTASSIVLSALSSKWSIAEADKAISERGDEGFKKVDDFWNLPELLPFTKKDDSDNGSNDDAETPKEVWDKADFSVNSEYFEVFAKVDLADRTATVEMLLYRNAETGKMRTYYRDFSRTEARIPATSSVNNSNNGSNP